MAQIENIFGESGDDLKDRWQQSASTLVSATANAADDNLIYTVTSGKVLYITSIVYYNETAGQDDIRLENGIVSGGSTVFHGGSDGYQTTSVNLTTPLEFTTGVYIDASANFTVTIVGWEE